LDILKKSQAFGKAEVILSILNGSTRDQVHVDFTRIELNFKRRTYASGKVNMDKYYSKLGTNGDVSLLNLSKSHYLQCQR
jgi:hypothetical protein